MKRNVLGPAAVAAVLVSGLSCAPQAQRAMQAPAAPEAGPGVARMDTLAIRGYTRFLADDRLAGRATGSTGADLAALYIVSSCVGLGLSPVGSSYFQPVDLEESAIAASGTELS